MSTLADLGEFEVIRRLDAVRPRGKDVRLGSGDDGAVLQPAAGRELVVTTDTFVEGRHFLPAWCDPAGAGRRLAVANLSDIAAMGARPRWALRASGVPPGYDVDDLVACEAGLAATLAQHEAHIVGGNLSATRGEAWFTLMLLGDVASGRAWTRAGARDGDVILVTGRPGRAGAGYRLVHARGEHARDPHWRALVDAWVAPVSRMPLVAELAGRDVVTAAVDVSDGLAADLGHVCRASGVGACIDLNAWPMDAALDRASAELGVDPHALRFGPSDDYELVLAAAQKNVPVIEAVAATAGVPVAVIGHFDGRAGRMYVGDAAGEREVEAAGFDHFGA